MTPRAPPRSAEALLRALVPGSYGEDVAEELARGYSTRVVQRCGRARASLWYWRQVIKPDTLRLGALLRARGRSAFGQGRPGGAAVEGVSRDVRLAVRGLLRSPLYAGAAILTLSLGIGANTAVFSVVDGVLLEPLPYPEAARLVRLWMTDEEDGDLTVPWSHQSLREVAAETATLESVSGYFWEDVTLTGLGEPERLLAVAVSGGLLKTLGVRPLQGRDLRADEAVPGGPAVAVISHSFWRARMGGDPDVVGRTLHLSGVPHEIVGVAPGGFRYPRGAEVWIPGRWTEGEFPRGRHFLLAVGRLAEGTAIRAAREELSAIAARMEQENPDTNRARGIRATSLAADTVRDVRLGLLILMGAVVLVLLIACANVANLLLVRGATRVTEIAVRATLGASRAVLIRQMAMESLVLALLGGGAGVGLALAGVRGLKAIAPRGLPRLDAVGVDGTVLVFAAVTALTVALLFGLAPAWRLTRASISTVIRSGRLGLGSAGERRMTGSGMLAAEVALSLTLLLGAGLLLRSFARIRSVELGFEPEHVQQFTLSLPSARYDDHQAVAFYEELGGRLAALPGVRAAGLVDGLPLGRSHTTMSFDVVGAPPRDPADPAVWLVRVATPGYLETLGIPLVKGRNLQASDRPGAPRVVVVSEGAADRYWPGADPLGARIDMGDGQPWTVVGVVGDVRSMDVTTATWPEAYYPHAQWIRKTMTAAIRGAPGVQGLLRTARAAVSAMDSDLPLYWVGTLEERIRGSMAWERFCLRLLGAFAALAVTLAAVGLYGVVAYRVSRREREIGIRIALGGEPAEVARAVVGQGMRPVAVGLVLGLGASLAGARVLAGLLYEVKWWDPAALAGAAALLAGVAALAVLLPLRSATRVPPSQAMRAD